MRFPLPRSQQATTRSVRSLQGAGPTRALKSSAAIAEKCACELEDELLAAAAAAAALIKSRVPPLRGEKKRLVYVLVEASRIFRPLLRAQRSSPMEVTHTTTSYAIQSTVRPYRESQCAASNAVWYPQRSKLNSALTLTCISRASAQFRFAGLYARHESRPDLGYCCTALLAAVRFAASPIRSPRPCCVHPPGRSNSDLGYLVSPPGMPSQWIDEGANGGGDKHKRQSQLGRKAPVAGALLRFASAPARRRGAPAGRTPRRAARLPRPACRRHPLGRADARPMVAAAQEIRATAVAYFAW